MNLFSFVIITQTHMWNVLHKSRQNNDSATLCFGMKIAATLEGSRCSFVLCKTMFLIRPVISKLPLLPLACGEKNIVYDDKFYWAWYFCRFRLCKYRSLVRS